MAKKKSAKKNDDAVFRKLRAIVKRHAKGLVVAVDEPGHYSVDTHTLAPNGRPLHFAGVAKRKSYVSVYLFPVYMEPALLDEMSAELRARMQGKSCFNFKRVDDELFAELDGLVAEGRAYYAREGRLR